MSNSNGIQGLSIHETTIAVIDFETTGLTPGLDRAVKASVYHLEPEKGPYLALDALFNPKRSMPAKNIQRSLKTFIFKSNYAV